ncbi:MAG: DUF4178 domain-containing protein [Lachnospiraceae bacterium]|nr:DUF4178 domain-containing protein [Lachnospiraceae bacterium]
MDIRVGTKLRVDGIDAKVIGFIEYANPQDRNNRWKEYRLSTNQGERWLSIDEVYKEYSISKPENKVGGNIGPEWKKVDEGRQVVVSCGGDVDVERGDSANFVEFEDETEEKTLSVEIWDDGTEYSTGYYLDANEIAVTGFEEPPKKKSGMGWLTAVVFLYVCFTVVGAWMDTTGFSLTHKRIDNFLKKSNNYSYVTSITGNEKQKADVYQSKATFTTDQVAKEIIDGIEGDTQCVTQKDDNPDEEIAIVTKKEYCLVYHPENEPNRVLVQISNRKYNYTSDNTPYKASKTGARWYRSHYYSSSYSKDASSFKRTPSAYTSYQGDTIHNLGNGYFDSYSSSVRQSSINSRSSSSGGGK